MKYPRNHPYRFPSFVSICSGCYGRQIHTQQIFKNASFNSTCDAISYLSRAELFGAFDESSGLSIGFDFFVNRTKISGDLESLPSALPPPPPVGCFIVITCQARVEVQYSPVSHRHLYLLVTSSRPEEIWS